MQGAAMPEASIHKDRDAPSRKYYVGSNIDSADFEEMIPSETKATPVEFRSDGKLRCGVSSLIGPH